MTTNIHPTACVHPGARFGANVQIGPFACIEDRVGIGDETIIGPHVTIFKYTTLGARCNVHSGAVIGDTPQDLAFKNVESYVSVGSGCVIREGVTIHRGTAANSTTQIGNDCYLMAFSHCAHNVKLGNNVIMANGSLLAGYVEVGDRAFISGNCAVHQFVRLGRLSILGGVCWLSKDVPPFCMARPVAYNRIGGLNVVGMRRAGMPPEARRQVKEAFDILYRSDLNTTQALEKIKATFTDGPALEISAFIESSKRGICRFVPSGPGEEEAD